VNAQGEIGKGELEGLTGDTETAEYWTNVYSWARDLVLFVVVNPKKGLCLASLEITVPLEDRQDMALVL
jgi:hypothetical protein